MILGVCLHIVGAAIKVTRIKQNTDPGLTVQLIQGRYIPDLYDLYDLYDLHDL